MFNNFWPLKRRLLIEWNFILLNGEDVDFFGCKVFAIDFAFEGDDFVWDVEGVEERAAVVAFSNDGGVVLNCNQSR